MSENYIMKDKIRKLRINKKESIKKKWAKIEKERRVNYTYNPISDKPDLKYIGRSAITPCSYSSSKFYTRRDKRKIFTYRVYEDLDLTLVYPNLMRNSVFNNSNYKKHMLRY